MSQQRRRRRSSIALMYFTKLVVSYIAVAALKEGRELSLVPNRVCSPRLLGLEVTKKALLKNQWQRRRRSNGRRDLLRIQPCYKQRGGK